MRKSTALLCVVLGALSIVAARPWHGTAQPAVETADPAPSAWVQLAGVRDDGRYWIRLDNVVWVQEKDGTLYVAFASVGSEPVIVQGSAENRKALGVD